MILSKETALFQKDAIANLASSSKYITKINDSGIKIHPYDDTVGEADANHFLSLTAEGMQIYNGGTSNSNVIAKFNTINNNPAVTIGFTSTGKYNTHITQDGLYLRTGTDSYAILNANGLVLSKGGIKAGDYINNPTKFIYLSTEDYTDSPTITIGDNNANWRQIIGNKFGVKNDGTLYASNAHVEGAITATSLIIGNGSNVYDGEAAINITGYTIEILQNSNHDLVTDPTENIWIYPVLYHNNNVVTVSDGRAFKWYKDNDTENPIIGNQIDGGMLGVYGSTYRVTYTFEDGAVVDGASPVQQNITVSDATHITEISNNGIKVHHSTNNNNYIQIDSNGLEVIQNGTSVAKYGTTARIGASAGSRFLMNSDSLQAYNSSGTKYFEVSSNGLSWGNSNTAATTSQVNNAAQTATNFIKVDGNGIKIQNSSDATDYLFIDSSKIAIYRDNIEKLQLTDSLLRLGDESNCINLDTIGMKINVNNIEMASFTEDGIIIGITPPDTGMNDSDKRWAVIDNLGFVIKEKGTGIYDETYSVGGFHKSITDSYTQYIGKSFSEGWSEYFTYSPVINTTITVHLQGPAYHRLVSFTAGTASTSNSVYYDGNRTVSSSTSTGDSSTPIGYLDDGTPLYPPGSETVVSGYATYVSYQTNEVNAGDYIFVGAHDDNFLHGKASALFGLDLIAQQEYQTALGKYNKNNAENVLEIGNGNYSGYYQARSNALEVKWTGAMTIAGTLTQSSDRKLKKHIAYLNDTAIDFINHLKPVYYNKDNENHLGFYAQDVEAIDPWHCMVGEMNGYKTLGYTEFIAPLVTYCQYLEKRITELETQLEGGTN